MIACKERIIYFFKKVKFYLDDKRSVLSRSIAMVLCVAICMSTFWHIYYSGALADLGSYKQQTLTNVGLNSPLLRNEVTAEKFEPWELEVFGIFMSNFAVPFADSMDSAFISGTGYGTKGRGLDALKFSCGGDIVAGGILQNMVRFVLDECATKQKPLFKRAKLYNNGVTQDLTGTSALENQEHAKLADILPVFCGFYNMYDLNDTVRKWTVGDDASNNVFLTKMSANGTFNGEQDVLAHSWMMCGYANADAPKEKVVGDKLVRIMPNLANLYELYIENGNAGRITAFDLSDSWDAQVLALCINYGFGKAVEFDVSTSDTKKTDCATEMDELLTSGLDDLLYMDACGNIIVKHNEKDIVVVPACMNCHLQRNSSRLNLLVAPILNDLCFAPYVDIAGSVSNQASIVNTEEYDTGSEELFGSGNTAYIHSAMIGTGIGMDTSAYVSETGKTNVSEGGVSQYGNLLLYNTSDQFWGYDENESTGLHFEEIRNFMLTNNVDLENNLCIGILDSALRYSTCTMTDLFGLIKFEDDKYKMCEATKAGANTSLLYSRAGDGSEPKFKDAIIHNLIDYFGSMTNAGTSPNTNLPVGVKRAAASAQLLQIWGVNNDNHFDEYNNTYAISLNEDIKSEHEIINSSKAIYADNTLFSNIIESNKVHDFVRDNLGWAYGAAAAATVIGGVGLGMTIAAGAAAAEAAGIAAGVAALASNPVGWIVSAGLLVGGVAGFILFTLWTDDKEEVAFANKAALCSHLMWANGMLRGINQTDTPISESDSEDAWRTKISTATSMADLGHALAEVKGDTVYAATIANGYATGYAPSASAYRKQVYDYVFKDNYGHVEEDGKEVSIFINHMYRQGLNPKKKACVGHMGKSVSIIAAPNAGLKEAKAYMCYANTTIFEGLASWMYIDYLKWYGFTTEGGPDSVINKELFSAIGSALIDPDTRSTVYNTIFGDEALTEEQKKQRVQDYTYLSLAPTSDGVEYRNQLAVDGEKKYIATEYNKICYGDPIASNAIGSDGMLKMVPYSENFLTKWLVENWDRVLVIMTLLAVIVLFIVMALKGRKVTWYVATLLSTILMLVVMPSSGEITPYVCDKIVQNMFQKGAQYWAINEGIENTYLAKEAEVQGAVGQEALQFIKALSVSNTSKSLMIKRDISKKVVCNRETQTQELLRLQSTRWILNSIIRQVSADEPENVTSYVYVIVDDMRGNLQDLFLLYEAAGSSLNASEKYNRAYIEDASADWAKNLAFTASKDLLNEEISKYYAGYVPLSMNFIDTPYRSISLSDSMITRSSHVKFGYLARLYYLPTYAPKDKDLIPMAIKKPINLTVPSIADAKGHITVNSINAFQNEAVKAAKKNKKNPSSLKNVGTSSNWKAFTAFIGEEQLGNKYSETGATQEHGFLHLTEDITPYFYLVVKDSFSYDFSRVDTNSTGATGVRLDYEDLNVPKDDGIGLGTLMTNLLGTFDRDKYSDSVWKREGVQYYTEIEKHPAWPETVTRDVLDLEYLFTNYIPYMSSVMFLAGGTDGTDGMLGKTTMEDCGFKIYGDSMASWLYRSNWVIKLISATNYSATASVPDKDGNYYTVEHQLFPQNYPKERPMVFSEAQMYKQGLTESQLTRVELACVETNKKVAEAWQMLVNYANTDGINSNIIEEQMAFEAAMIFNREFADDNFISSEAALYPTSFDLRSINFDSVLKLIVISDNYNNASLQQDAIYTIMADKGVWGGRFALAAAWLAQVAVPLVRNFTLGVLFYLALISCVYNLLNDNRHKAKASVGGIVSNSIYAAYTIAYYCVFWLLITRAGGDMILTEEGFNTGTSNIMWKLIIIIIASILFILKSCGYVYRVVIKDIPGMGMSIMQQYARSTYDKLKTVSSRIRSKFGSKKAAEELRTSAAKDVADTRNKVEGNGDGNGGGNGDAGKDAISIDGGDVIIKNDKDNPIPVFTTNAPSDATYVEPYDESEDSGYVEEDTDSSESTSSTSESGSTGVSSDGTV